MNDEVVIKKGLNIGELDAESDRSLLSSCFIDNGILEQLMDVESHASVILGRTGSGKSALIYKIFESSNLSKLLDPNDISVQFLEHSNIIKFFGELSIKLDLFYRVLWRHILTVELVKLRYDIHSDKASRDFVSRVSRWLQRDPTRKRAIEYFSEWGDRFWLETDEHLRELTEKLTNDVKARLGVKYQQIDLSAEGARSLSKEVRTEITSLATRVVSEIQIKRLNEVLELLAENAFDDRQKQYYILIDRLDEDWAETDTRCHFIRALIEETKSFRKIPHVKVISALWRDLLDLVFDRTRNAGFQEEKYEAYLSAIRWSKDDLTNLIETRVKEVYRRQYTSQTVGLFDVFPTRPRHDGPPPIDYIIERTLFRPRDVIQFANACFTHALGRPRISWRAIKAAEATYSTRRLKSLFDEWADYYPSLQYSIEILRGLPATFTRSNVTKERLQDVAAELCELGKPDACTECAEKLYEAKSGIKETDLASELLLCLYHVGAIGVKISTLQPFAWSFLDQPRLTRSEIKRANQIKVHKMLRHALETRSEELPFGSK